CQASLGNELSSNVWALEGCSGAPPSPIGLVAVRASEATHAARLEFHWIGESPSEKSTKPVAPWRDGNESTWRPYTIVNLTGDRRREVAVFCRRPATSEYECERSMVQRLNEKEVGWFIPVARARWTPGGFRSEGTTFYE